MSDRSLSIFDDDPEDNDMPDETDVIETADGDAERTQVMPAAPAAPLPQRRPAQDSTPTRRVPVVPAQSADPQGGQPAQQAPPPAPKDAPTAQQSAPARAQTPMPPPAGSVAEQAQVNARNTTAPVLPPTPQPTSGSALPTVRRGGYDKAAGDRHVQQLSAERQRLDGSLSQ